jgi:tRNA-specific 2-thiouridylase
MSKGKVVVGMSGGVDSSVAAYLLKEQGYDVIGVTMEIWQSESEDVQQMEGGCCGLSAVDDARRVAAELGIPYYVMNFRDVFQKTVIDNFVDEYLHARTPNPCIRCNRFVKWEALLNRSLSIGADFIATGHYAKVVKLSEELFGAKDGSGDDFLSGKNQYSSIGRYAVKKSVTQKKDQTYALYNLTQEQLKHTLMPVGDYCKEEIRDIANRVGLPVASKPDSQEICFVPDQDYAGFICRETGCQVPEGNFVDRDGNVIGRHKGLIHYTIGQRKGLNLALGKPVYVSKLCPERNEVVVGDEEEVFTDTLMCNDLNHMAVDRFPTDRIVTAKIRYGNRETPCRIEYLEEDLCRCRFEEKVRAATPGQSVVFYWGDVVLGGGTIL